MGWKGENEQCNSFLIGAIQMSRVSGWEEDLPSTSAGKGGWVGGWVGGKRAFTF